MLGEKNVNRLTGFVICLMILLTGLLVYISQNETIVASLTSSSQPTYVEKVFNSDEIMEIDIQISEENWNEMIENATAEEYVMADIVINGEVFQSVGIRPKGNSSLTTVASDSSTDRYSFKVNFSKYVDNQTLYGLQKMVFNNMIGDATYMKEYLSYDMFSAMGIATPAYAYANIKVNGEPWGVYLALEVMEESFVERYFGSVSANLYKPESMDMGAMGNKGDKQDFMKMGEMPSDMPTGAGEIPSDMPTGAGKIPSDMPTGAGEMPGDMPTGVGEMPSDVPTGAGEMPSGMPTGTGESLKQMQPGNGGMSSGGTSLVYIDDELSSYSAIFDNSVLKGTTEDAYYTVIEMIRNLNEGINLEQYLDIEEILRYFAVNTFLVNLDSYAGSMKHNYYLYEEDGVFQILPWDLNLSFGAFQMSDASNVINFPIDEPVSDTMENSPLISKLLEVDEYQEMYHQYLEELIAIYIESGRYESTIQKLDDLIREAVSKDETAFYTYEEYQTSLPHLIQFGYDRTISIQAQLSGEQPSTSYGTIETDMNLAALGSQNGAGNQKEMMVFNPSEQASETDENLLSQESKEPDMVDKQPVQKEQTPLMDASLMEELQSVMATIDATQIQKIILQLSGKTEETLTEEDLSLLKDYGIEEELISTVLELIEKFGSFSIREGGGQGEMQSAQRIKQILVPMSCLMILIPGIAFVSHYKKRKFTS